jgi:hypothetical protein
LIDRRKREERVAVGTLGIYLLDARFRRQLEEKSMREMAEDE